MIESLPPDVNMIDVTTATLTGDSHRSFADAVQERYADPLSGSSETLVVGAPGCDRAVDLLLTPQKEIEQLTRRITLTHMMIDSVGEVSDEMSHRLCHVKELDLSYNALTNWPLVTEIITKLPACEELVVSGNPQMMYACDFPCAEVILFKKRMQNVTTIIMASCDYEWHWVLCTALEVWPQTLRSLSLHGNHISDLSVPPAYCFPLLQSLDLSANPISEWNQVCKLGSLPALRELSVSDCKIEIISFNKEAAGKLFPQLNKLNLSGNKLDNWIDVAELRFLTQLNDLNLKGNPVIRCGADYAASFNLVLGRLSGLVKLNGEQVTDAMYQEAEKYYVRTAFRESTRKGPAQEFDSSHPRFNELIEKYGAPEEAATVKAKHVCVILLAEDGNEITKKLPYSTTVSALKVLMKRTFGLEATCDIDLVLKTRKEDEYEYVLNEEDSPLSFYDVGNDDVILIRTK